MARTLYRKEIEEILVGATLLGAGGGGSLSFSLDMLDRLESGGTAIQLELLDLEEIAPKDCGAMVASLGSPVAMKAGQFGPDCVHAFQAFQRAFAARGKEVKYLYSGEMGGLNTFIPMLVSILWDRDPAKRIPLLDVDSNGRAVPELNTTLVSARGYPPSPLGLGNLEGDMIAVYPVSDASGEAIARQLCMLYDMQIGFSTWGMSRDELKENGVPGCVTLAQKVGKAVQAARCGGDLLATLGEVLPCRHLVTGEITSIALQAAGGFDSGATVIQDENGGKWQVLFKNENILVKDASGKVRVTVPDLILMADAGTGQPLTNADTEEGMTVHLLASPAHPNWWAEDQKAYRCWQGVLDAVGYSGPQIKYEECMA